MLLLLLFDKNRNRSLDQNQEGKSLAGRIEKNETRNEPQGELPDWLSVRNNERSVRMNRRNTLLRGLRSWQKELDADQDERRIGTSLLKTWLTR